METSNKGLDCKVPVNKDWGVVPQLDSRCTRTLQDMEKQYNIIASVVHFRIKSSGFYVPVLSLTSYISFGK